jgi:hypothetical protein
MVALESGSFLPIIETLIRQIFYLFVTLCGSWTVLGAFIRLIRLSSVLHVEIGLTQLTID